MRSALICVFLTLVVQNYGSRTEDDEDFKPTPIPLIDWPSEKQEAAGTLHEMIKTDAPQAVAAVPAHYWEDALRHSVYLTLVRDKIDQLIAKGAVVSPDSKPDNLPKEVDDHDLWEKIKTARFDRLREEPIPPADVTILAKGRLVEDRDGFRFAEDDASRSNCSEINCTKGVKAFWSVKRVRQGELYPGKYHYELTFSVTSQTNRKLKKPYENPVRTFTIKENSPTERPQARNHGPSHVHVQRPQRAVWVHKNLDIENQHKRSQPRGLDRIFSSLFSDEDSYEENNRYKHKTYIPQIQLHHTKVGFVDDRNAYHLKKQTTYPISKPQSYRYNHPPIPPTPVSYMQQHPYIHADPAGNGQFMPPYTDNRYLPSNIVKTTRPAVLPTPITNYPLVRESTIEVPVKTKPNVTEHTTKVPETLNTYKIYNHPKPSQPMKVSYFPEHIRPPVYNAPPGVFVTMDKKPFKPMPPLKFSHSNKPQKHTPLDFRPSPQVLDTQFSDPDLQAEAAFRPITMNYTEEASTVKHDTTKKVNNNNRKTITGKKPPKKHEIIKSHRLTTIAPEIITAQTVPVEDHSMEWANVLGAFTKTTPMASHRDRGSVETTESIITTSTPTNTENIYKVIDIEVSSEAVRTTSTTTTTTTTTTPKSKKRTRPPHKFTKPEKIKKHKRVTSTTTSTTTIKPTRKYPIKKPSEDLTPQASSAATSGANSIWEPKNPKAPVATTTTSTTPRPTTTTKPPTTTTTPSTTRTDVETEQPVATTQPKSKNRFRQSTLMHKGTSVNHDKWSTPAFEKNRTNSVLSTKFPLRRKASKFTGYIPSSTPRTPEVERDREDHKDHTFDSNAENISTSITTENSDDISAKMPQPTEPTVEGQIGDNDTSSEWNHENIEEAEEFEIEELESENDVREPNDDNEYIFPTASTIHEIKSDFSTVEKQPPTTELTIVETPHSTGKNKTKCKKKKHNNLTNLEGSSLLTGVANISSSISTSTTTTQAAVTPDIFEELFGGFTMDDVTEKSKIVSSTPPSEPSESESEQHAQYVNADDDLEDFLHSLDQESNHHEDDNEAEEEYDDDEKDNEDSPFNNDEENLDSRSLNDEYYDNSQEREPERPFSLLELMAME